MTEIIEMPFGFGTRGGPREPLIRWGPDNPWEGAILLDIRVATNLEKPGILREFSEPGKLMELTWNSVQPYGKIITNKIIAPIEYLHKATFYWVNRIIIGLISGSRNPAQ